MHCNGWSGSLRRTPAIIHEYCIVAKPKLSLEFNQGILGWSPPLLLPFELSSARQHPSLASLYTANHSPVYRCHRRWSHLQVLLWKPYCFESRRPTHVHQTLHVIRRGPQYLEMWGFNGIKIWDLASKFETLQKSSNVSLDLFEIS